MTDTWGYDQCPGYKRTCDNKKLHYFKYCLDCATANRVDQAMKALQDKKDKEFMQDKQALALTIN